MQGVADAVRRLQYHGSALYPENQTMKLTHAAILVFLLPAGLAAQQPPAGAAKDPITTVFRNRTMAQQRNLAQAFDSIPANLFSYKPTPAQHVA